MHRYNWDGCICLLTYAALPAFYVFHNRPKNINTGGFVEDMNVNDAPGAAVIEKNKETSRIGPAEKFGFMSNSVALHAVAVFRSIYYLFFPTNVLMVGTTTGPAYCAMSRLSTNRDSHGRSPDVFRNLDGAGATAAGALACMPLYVSRSM